MGSMMMFLFPVSNMVAQPIFISIFCSGPKYQIQQNMTLKCYSSSSMLMAEYRIAMSFPFTIESTTSMITVVRKLSEILKTHQCFPRLVSDQ